MEIFASEPSVSYSAPQEEWKISISASKFRRLGGHDRPNEDWFSLVDADLLGQPIPQYCKNPQTPISIVCQFSSNCSIKLLPKRVDWFTTCVGDLRDLFLCGNIR